MKANDPLKSNCPLARAMEILGEGWTLLVLREAFLGTRRFNDFERELGIARNVLTVRLRKLVDAGIFDRVPSAEDRRVVEYRLSRAGRELVPVLVSISQWSMTWLCDQQVPVRFVDRASGEEIPPVQVRNRLGEVLGARDIVMLPGPGADAAVKRRYGSLLESLSSQGTEG
ncbi:DNA-binding HxlR family transcriptional regulator [Natronocella acetinitrilica]|uniref:DNA-binding HxlR family transcriptional regulator n=1 Tax=Natronocella acetinitrilica TaxID=414046 RepID=A0AAE3KDQ2_9GAMM|nr:helix-turn-helix domain-containing protein [Natronocella acetinitrilica]MCP1677104.1 DNA-binding HxlR family transcriptional regulator [Natronocella acetinitrilica]